MIFFFLAVFEIFGAQDLSDTTEAMLLCKGVHVTPARGDTSPCRLPSMHRNERKLVEPLLFERSLAFNSEAEYCTSGKR